MSKNNVSCPRCSSDDLYILNINWFKYTKILAQENILKYIISQRIFDEEQLIR
jgi:hypothetical protein